MATGTKGVISGRGRSSGLVSMSGLLQVLAPCACLAFIWARGPTTLLPVVGLKFKNKQREEVSWQLATRFCCRRSVFVCVSCSASATHKHTLAESAAPNLRRLGCTLATVTPKVKARTAIQSKRAAKPYST